MATCGRPIFSRVPRMFVNSAIVLSPRGRSDTTQFTRVPYGATNSKLMAGALITTLMREDHLSKASVYRYLGVGDATQFTSYSQTAAILEYTFWGVGQKTPTIILATALSSRSLARRGALQRPGHAVQDRVG